MMAVGECRPLLMFFLKEQNSIMTGMQFTLFQYQKVL